jgi:hypothetical protein
MKLVITSHGKLVEDNSKEKLIKFYEQLIREAMKKMLPPDYFIQK